MGIFLLDGISGTACSEEHRNLAQDLYHRYPNLRLTQIPVSQREENEEFPFAIRDTDTDEIVKPLRESQCNRDYVMRWLWENDSNRVDTYAKFQEEAKAAKEAQLKQAEDRDEEKLDFVSSVLKSPLHTYRHNGKVIGDGYRSDH